MPSQRRKISDLWSQLGLRAPYSKRNLDWKANPRVHDMYSDLSEICKLHYVKPMEVITKCPELHNAAMKLLKRYGAVIWSSATERPWLLSPGEGAASAPCERRLFYTDALDQQFLQETFYTLVVEKTLRWRKDHIRESHVRGDGESDTNYTPTPGPSSNGGASGKQPQVTGCFAASLTSHYDASHLAANGVWLGDFNEEKNTVNDCISWDDVGANYFEATIGATECSRGEPFAFDTNPPANEMHVECAMCHTRLKISCSLLEHKEESTETVMSKNIWVFRCDLGGEEVFACVKELPEREWRRLGSDVPLWSFWRREEGYTKSWMLKSLPPGTTTPLLQSDLLQHGGFENGRKRLHEPADTVLASDTVLVSKRLKRSSLSLFNHTVRGDSPDSLYDTTPQPSRGVPARISEPSPQRLSKTGTRFLEPVTEPQASQPSQSQAPAGEGAYAALNESRGINMPPPALSMRFEIWFSVPWGIGRNAIVLDDSMSVQDLYSKVRSRLRRQLEGKSLVALGVKLDSQALDEESINIEVDDDEGWEVLMKIVRGMEKKELVGMIHTK